MADFLIFSPSDSVFQVRGTPGSGKTTLMDLLHAYILSNVPGATVITANTWCDPCHGPKTITGRMDAFLKLPDRTDWNNVYLLFDNAQFTYWDGALWDNFFKDCVQRRKGPATILFCSYGNPSEIKIEATPTPLHVTPPVIVEGARVSLRPIPGRLPPVGLLFTRQEFDDAVSRFSKPDGTRVPMAIELQTFLFDLTSGHPGAVADLLSMLATDVCGIAQSICPMLNNCCSIETRFSREKLYLLITSSPITLHKNSSRY